MNSGGVVGGMMAVVAARRREEILARLRAHGATSQARALTLEELGLARGPMLALQLRQGVVQETAGGRFYLDEAAASRQARRRGRLIATLLVLAGAGLLAVLVAG